MTTDFKKGDKVINPDTTKSSPNYIGEVVKINTYKELPGKKFAWVKFRDYEGGYVFDILKHYSN